MSGAVSFVHDSSYSEENVAIGKGMRIGRFCERLIFTPFEPASVLVDRQKSRPTPDCRYETIERLLGYESFPK